MDEKIFVDLEQEKIKRLENNKAPRLKFDKYNPDGTKSEVFSFYDCIKGAAGRTKLFTEAIEKAS